MQKSAAGFVQNVCVVFQKFQYQVQNCGQNTGTDEVIIKIRAAVNQFTNNIKKSENQKNSSQTVFFLFQYFFPAEWQTWFFVVLKLGTNAGTVSAQSV